ncbi:MAG: hypothetical protein R3B72_32635 [Polyangiaceae bacterium]
MRDAWPRLRHTVAAVACLAASLSGCASGPRATHLALQHRAVFDLGCDARQIALYVIDDRTRAVAGCGRRLLYVEDCEANGSTLACTWKLDTPSFAQQAWPQAPPAPPTVHTPSPVAARPTRRDIRETLDDVPPGTRRPTPTELFDDDRPGVLDHRN